MMMHQVFMQLALQTACQQSQAGSADGETQIKTSDNFGREGDLIDDDFK